MEHIDVSTYPTQARNDDRRQDLFNTTNNSIRIYNKTVSKWWELPCFHNSWIFFKQKSVTISLRIYPLLSTQRISRVMWTTTYILQLLLQKITFVDEVINPPNTLSLSFDKFWTRISQPSIWRCWFTTTKWFWREWRSVQISWRGKQPSRILTSIIFNAASFRGHE